LCKCNGQTYATRGVPYFRVSRIFMSRIFHPCNLVPKIHVSQFPPLHSGAAFSCPAISCLAFSASPPNLLAIIAAQKAQSIQRSVTEARIFVHSVPAAEKKHAPLLPMSAGLTVNKSIRAEECDHAHRCTRKLPSRFLWQQA